MEEETHKGKSAYGPRKSYCHLALLRLEILGREQGTLSTKRI